MLTKDIGEIVFDVEKIIRYLFLLNIWFTFHLIIKHLKMYYRSVVCHILMDYIAWFVTKFFDGYILTIKYQKEVKAMKCFVLFTLKD